jgi:hypothetical protein
VTQELILEEEDIFKTKPYLNELDVRKLLSVVISISPIRKQLRLIYNLVQNLTIQNRG